MTSDPMPEADHQSQRLHQMESSIEAINARIARLAMALGVSLRSEADLAQVLTRPAAVASERRSTPERRATERSELCADRRMAHLREELRGLLVLRYSVEKHYVEDAGVAMTHEILLEAEANLLRRGFKPGADGIKPEQWRGDN